MTGCGATAPVSSLTSLATPGAPAAAPSAAPPAPSSSATAPAAPTSGGSSSGSTSTTTTTPSALPAVPSGAKVFSQVQNTTDAWSDCSTCAGGQATTANYWTAAFQTTPSLSGSSREFYNGGGPWANALWIKKFGNQDQATHILADFWMSLDSGAAGHLWTAEFDMWQSVAGQEFMIGSQCNFGGGVWDLWNAETGHWVATTIPCPRMTAGTWYHVQWYVERISANQYRYDTLVVDGVAHALNQVFTTNPIGWADSSGVQWQLDLDSSGTPATEWIDNVTVSIW